tara:strand:+ start:347 stop:1141 length:795 start_codon:yes stop_codon:yes gene_type:complete
MEPLTSSKIKINNIQFGTVKKYSNGLGKFIELIYNYNKFCLQTPKLLCKYGINKNYNDKTGDLKDYSLNLYLYYDQDKEIKIDKFRTKIEKFDKRVLKYVKKNSLNVLNKNNITDEELETIYYKSLKYKRLQDSDEIDNSVPPFITVKLKKFWKLKFSDNTVIDDVSEDNIQKYINSNAIVKAIIVPMLWFVNNNFGITYQVKEIIIYDQGSNYTNNKNDKNNKTQNKYQQSKLDLSLFKINHNNEDNNNHFSDTETDSDNYSD